MKASTIYLKAAKARYKKRADNSRDNYGCCDFIVSARTGEKRGIGPTSEASAFIKLFKPRCQRSRDWDNNLYWGNYWSESMIERKACRVLALLFMHQIALDEEGRR